MHLFVEPFLPVRCRDRRRRWITVAELSDPDVLTFDADRADFNGALNQFAIAVLQMVAAPGSKAEWQQRYRQPPDAAALADCLAPYRDCFRLDGDGPRFMQDFELRAGDSDPTPIASLLVETPGENTLKNNGDHFIKRHQVQGLCPHCAATALFTLQVNAPAGGAGNRTSLRGGGPLTTLLLAPSLADGPRSLWHTLWLNVMLAGQFNTLNGELEHAELHHRMPWMRPISATQRVGGTTAPSQVHPLHVYWAMPRRIRLDFAQIAAGDCDVCGRPSDRLIRQYAARPQGLNYKGPWRHPLSPYYTVKGEKLPMHPQPGGLGYRQWLGMVLGMHNDKRQIESAGVLSALMGDHLLDHTGIAPQLWVFGYDMDNAKARCWYEATVPLLDLAECSTEDRQQMCSEVSAWIAGAEQAATYLRGAVKDAWFSHDARGDFSHVDAAFWSSTEPGFYALLRERMSALRGGAQDDGVDSRQRWLGQLESAARHLFEHDFVGTGPVAGQNLARTAGAHHQLLANLRGSKLRGALALPEPVKPEKASSKRNPPATGPALGAAV